MSKLPSTQILESVFNLWKKVSDKLLHLVPESASLLLASVILCILYNFAFLWSLGVAPSVIGLTIYDVIVFDEIIWWFITLFLICAAAHLIESINTVRMLFLTSTWFILIRCQELILGDVFDIKALFNPSFFVNFITAYVVTLIVLVRFRKLFTKHLFHFSLLTILHLATLLACMLLMDSVANYLGFLLHTGKVPTTFFARYDIVQLITFVPTFALVVFLNVRFKKNPKLVATGSLTIFIFIITLTYCTASVIGKINHNKNLASSAVILKDGQEIDASIITTFSSGTLLATHEGIQFIKSEEISSIIIKAEFIQRYTGIKFRTKSDLHR